MTFLKKNGIVCEYETFQMEMNKKKIFNYTDFKFVDNYFKKRFFKIYLQIKINIYKMNFKEKNIFQKAKCKKKTLVETSIMNTERKS